MSETINTFRDFIKPDLKKTAFSVKEALEQTSSLVRDSFNSSNIRLDTFSEDIEIIGFHNQFCHVLLNLLQNSRDAINENQTKQGRVTISCSGAENSVVIEVMDNGGGIAPQIIGKIFDPYFSTKGSKGTGIGLYMSKKIIEDNMNGMLSVASVENTTRFTIKLPVGEGQ